MITAIRDILLVNASITALVNDRIFNLQRWQGTALPAIVIFRVSTKPTDSKCTPSSMDKISIQISIFAETDTAADTLATLTRSSLDRYQGTSNNKNISSIVFDNEHDQFDDAAEIVHKIQEYTVIEKR